METGGRMTRRTYTLLAAGLLLGFTEIRAAEYFVDAAGSDSASGLATNTAWRSLQTSVNRLQAGDTLWIRGGVYRGGVYRGGVYRGGVYRGGGWGYDPGAAAAVGIIGGVDKKVVAADKEGAEVFFAPTDQTGVKKSQTNYAVAKRTAKKLGTKMKIVPVATFDDALKYLQKHYK